MLKVPGVTLTLQLGRKGYGIRAIPSSHLRYRCKDIRLCSFGDVCGCQIKYLLWSGQNASGNQNSICDMITKEGWSSLGIWFPLL
ncbi:hypothetical protein BABINDRAFT_161253 [Babjeviella inositovora NRRL Y-12698]|uniref:Uncharacterized protein n=1 Tax=Babjeviella inositovora NRRL Y-12698 TaxID=984486 RepID=A0A1E3QRI5_9ASCO|nr:uncharacterized protein BABINDRAFT_161253 [Babjeviella inositovora NRRL Y-12698]ODQ80291.1 hypothetical protein BABINDRAFT_161253 [Babjeviella inositovora NRRL Y-12698]